MQTPWVELLSRAPGKGAAGQGSEPARERALRLKLPRGRAGFSSTRVRQSELCTQSPTCLAPRNRRLFDVYRVQCASCLESKETGSEMQQLFLRHTVLNNQARVKLHLLLRSPSTRTQRRSASGGKTWAEGWSKGSSAPTHTHTQSWL